MLFIDILLILCLGFYVFKIGYPIHKDFWETNNNKEKNKGDGREKTAK